MMNLTMKDLTKLLHAHQGLWTLWDALKLLKKLSTREVLIKATVTKLEISSEVEEELTEVEVIEVGVEETEGGAGEVTKTAVVIAEVGFLVRQGTREVTHSLPARLVHHNFNRRVEVLYSHHRTLQVSQWATTILQGNNIRHSNPKWEHGHHSNFHNNFHLNTLRLTKTR